MYIHIHEVYFCWHSVANTSYLESIKTTDTNLQDSVYCTYAQLFKTKLLKHTKTTEKTMTHRSCNYLETFSYMSFSAHDSDTAD